VIHKPVNLGPTVNSSFGDEQPAISADGLTLLFASDRPGGHGDRDLWICTRPSSSEPFGKPENLGRAVNSSFCDSGPVLSGDGLTLLFHSSRPGGLDDMDMWMCQRAAPDKPFGQPINLSPTVNQGYANTPALSADGLTLFFASYCAGGLGDRDLWMSRRASTEESFGVTFNLGPTVNSNFVDGGPVLSADGLTLLFHSNRPGGRGKDDLWMSTRASLTESFGRPVNLGPSVNRSMIDGSPTLSGDSRTLVFDSTRPGGHGRFDLWMARIDRREVPSAENGSGTPTSEKAGE
jgi:Tol biopolymer transport system component